MALLLGLLLILPGSLSAQWYVPFTVPDWTPIWDDGHPPAPSTVLDDTGEFRLYSETVSLSGTASGGVGRFLGRVRSAVGMSDFTLTVTLRERIEPTEPDLQVLMEVYLRDLPEKLPGSPYPPYLAFSHPDLQQAGATLSETKRGTAGGELVEATFAGSSGNLRLRDWVALLSLPAVEGRIAGREFRITGDDLDRLRSQVLRIARSGVEYDPRLLGTPPGERTPVRTRHAPTAPLSEDRLHAMMGERIQGIPSDLPTNPLAPGMVVRVTPPSSRRPGDPTDDDQAFVIFQNVKNAEWVEDIHNLDWRPMAGVGDRLYLSDGPEPDAPVVVRRRYAVRDLQGGCSNAIVTTGWLYEVEFAPGAGNFRLDELGKIALARPANGRWMEAESRQPPPTLGEVIRADIRGAVAAHPRHEPSSLDGGARTLTIRADGKTFTFWTVVLTTPPSDWDPRVSRTYVLDESGSIVQRMDFDPWTPVFLIEPEPGGNQEVLLQTGTLRFENGTWILPEVRSFSHGSC